MSVLQGMTESLFSETLKRLAEDVWQKKFSEAAKSVADSNGKWSNGNVLKSMISDAFIDALQKDIELRQALTDAVAAAAREYFNLKAGAK